MIDVLHVGKFYYPHCGGIETVVRGIARTVALVPGVSVRVIVYNDEARTVTDVVDGVVVRRLGSLGAVASQPICPSMPCWLGREKADIVNLHLPNPLAEVSWLVSKHRGPLVVSYHSDVVKQGFLKVPRSLILRKVLSRADAIVVATPNHIRYSQTLRRYEEKCVVIPYGIDLGRFSLTKDVKRRRDEIWGQSPGPKILFVGRLVYYKGLQYLLECMGKVEARLFVIGSGPLENEAKALAASLGLKERVVFLGSADETEKLAHLHACDVLVLPSVEPSEAFGIAQIEAMACRKPVISTDLRSGVPYVNRHGVTGLVVRPRDVAGLAGAVNILLGDDALREKLGAGGRRMVETEYTEELMGERYYQLYLDILGAGALPVRAGVLGASTRSVVGVTS